MYKIGDRVKILSFSNIDESGHDVILSHFRNVHAQHPDINSAVAKLLDLYDKGTVLTVTDVFHGCVALDSMDCWFFSNNHVALTKRRTLVKQVL